MHTECKRVRERDIIDTEVGIEHVNLGDHVKLKYIPSKKKTFYSKMESRFASESTFLRDIES